MAVPDKNKYIKEAQDKYNPQRQKELSLSNTEFNNQKQSVTKQYNREIDAAGDAYTDMYSDASVQKYINEREIAENMANLGLVSSGVKSVYDAGNQNRYLNTTGGLDRSKQRDIDSLAGQLNDALTDIENSRTLQETKINNYYDNLISEEAESRYEQAVAEEEQRKLEEQLRRENEQLRNENEEMLKEKNMPYYKLLGSYKNSSGKTVYKFADRNGKEWHFDAGINPYTGQRIGGYTNEQLKRYGVWNGYQPKGVVIDGYDYGKVELEEKNAVNYQGHVKSIWKTKENYKGRNGNPLTLTKYWIWDDYLGRYIPAKKVEEGKEKNWYIDVPT